jgi:hypothetical protein
MGNSENLTTEPRGHIKYRIAKGKGNAQKFTK